MFKTSRYIYLFCIFLISIAAFSYAFAAGNPDAVVGNWLTEGGKAKIYIYKNGNKYFGKIAWVEKPNDPNGHPKLDKNNPDKALRNKPIVGLVLLRNFEYTGKNVWENGNIYDPESGKDYSCTMTLLDANKLEVRGYIGISLLGRSQTWTRAK
ncbi:MAG: DUF2147 domain-containing protein [Sphingobacteriaceae bacterium]|nr:MAG: DUF2147 domain-containing protein [Sphingobacteriaceae bacterium]